jgi:ubiquinone/menaquinone biosynthesis C-methylase UbiE
VQLRFAGEFAGKRILDVGCGTGDKARYFAEHGAAHVLAIGPNESFAKQWAEHQSCENLELVQGGFDDLPSLPQLQSQQFDIVVCFQSLMYTSDLRAAVKTFTSLLLPGGTLVVSVPHPFRLAIFRNEIEGWGHGRAYQQTGAYRYRSPWKADALLEHAMPRISDYLNAFSDAGFRLLTCEEPPISDELRTRSPEKAAWMERYVGTILFKARLEV